MNAPKTDDRETSYASSSPSPYWLIMGFVTVAAASAVLASFIKPPSATTFDDGGPLIGTPLPELKVEGWINGPGPTNAELSGHVVLVDAWAYWCGPCRELAPTLKRLHDEYAPQGVRFIGLTSMDSRSLELSEKFVELEGITWPQGYGALSPLISLEADAIPQIWIFGRDGRMVWNSRMGKRLETALDDALAQNH